MKIFFSNIKYALLGSMPNLVDLKFNFLSVVSDVLHQTVRSIHTGNGCTIALGLSLPVGYIWMLVLVFYNSYE